MCGTPGSTIEPPAVRRLAESATKDVLKELDAELERVRFRRLTNPREFTKAGVRFHVKLVELSGNHTLTAVIGMLSEIIDRELAKSLAELGPDSEEVRRSNRRALRGYESIADLIRAGDGEAAERAWRRT